MKNVRMGNNMIVSWVSFGSIVIIVCAAKTFVNGSFVFRSCLINENYRHFCVRAHRWKKVFLSCIVKVWCL
jgi:hypothetical protein